MGIQEYFFQFIHSLQVSLKIILFFIHLSKKNIKKKVPMAIKVNIRYIAKYLPNLSEKIPNMGVMKTSGNIKTKRVS